MINLKTIVRFKKPDSVEHSNNLSSNLNLNKKEYSKAKDNKLNSSYSKRKDRNKNNKPKQNKASFSNTKTSKSSTNNYSNESNIPYTNLNNSYINSKINNLLNNVCYTIFTSKENGCNVTNKENNNNSNETNKYPKSLVCIKKPVKGKLINSSFTTENDLFENSTTLLKDSSLFNFDYVLNENVINDLLYQDIVKPNINNLFQGKSSIFIAFGPTTSGKSYSIRGDDKYSNELGILDLAVKDILNLIELSNEANVEFKKASNYNLKLSIYQVFGDNINDLLSKKFYEQVNIKSNKKSSINNDEYYNLNTMSIEFCHINNLKDLDKCYKTSNQYRKLLSQTYKINDIKRKSTIVYSFTLEKKDKLICNNSDENNKNSSTYKSFPNYSKIEFVELPSSEYGIVNNNYTQSHITNNNQSINKEFKQYTNNETYVMTSKLFNSIADNLVTYSNYKEAKIRPKIETALTYTLKNTLLRNNTSVYFMCCVNPVEYPLESSYNCLKFSSWLRNQALNNKVNQDIVYNKKRTKDNNNYNNVEKISNELDTQYCPDYMSNDYGFNNINNSTNISNEYHKNSNTINDYNESLESENENDKNAQDINNSYIRKIKAFSNYNQNLNIDDNSCKQYITDCQVKDNLNNSNEIIYNNTTNTPNRNYEKYNNNTTICKNNTSNDSNYNTSNFKDKFTTKQLQQNNKENSKNHQNKAYNNTSNNSTINALNIQDLENQLSSLEKTKQEVSRYLKLIKEERGNIDYKVNNNYELNKLTQENQILHSDNIMLKEDVNRLSELTLRLEEDIIRQRNRNLEIANELEISNQEKVNQKIEIDQLKEYITKYKQNETNQSDIVNIKYYQDNKISQLESELKKLTQEKNNIEIEHRVLQERFSEVNKNYNIEREENRIIANKNKEEIANIENKFDKMLQQIDKLSSENNNFRISEEKSRININNIEKQKEDYFEKYQDYKNKYKILNNKLGDLESELRNLMFQRENDLYEKKKNDTIRKERITSKQKILEDFHKKITNYKNHITNNRIKNNSNKQTSYNLFDNKLLNKKNVVSNTRLHINDSFNSNSFD